MFAKVEALIKRIQDFIKAHEVRRLRSDPLDRQATLHFSAAARSECTATSRYNAKPRCTAPQIEYSYSGNLNRHKGNTTIKKTDIFPFCTKSILR